MCVRSVSADWIRFTLVSVWASSGCGCGASLLSNGSLEPFTADSQGFYFCEMLEHNAATQQDQIELHRKSDTAAPLQHRVTFQKIIFHWTSQTKRHCVQSQAWSQQRFSEATIVPDSVINVKFCSLVTPSGRLCCALTAAWTQLMGVDGQQNMEQTCSQWDPGDSHVVNWKSEGYFFSVMKTLLRWLFTVSNPLCVLSHCFGLFLTHSSWAALNTKNTKVW